MGTGPQSPTVTGASAELGCLCANLEAFMRRPGPLLTQFLTTIIIGGVAIGACVAALLPGTAVFANSIKYQSDAVGKLRNLDQRSTIYDASLNQIGVLGTQNRQYVKLSAVPKILQDAVISVEDKTF
jgi:membrane peptidoglycan carboxypeptidase